MVSKSVRQPAQKIENEVGDSVPSLARRFLFSSSLSLVVVDLLVVSGVPSSTCAQMPGGERQLHETFRSEHKAPGGTHACARPQPTRERPSRISGTSSTPFQHRWSLQEGTSQTCAYLVREESRPVGVEGSVVRASHPRQAGKGWGRRR